MMFVVTGHQHRRIGDGLDLREPRVKLSVFRVVAFPFGQDCLTSQLPFDSFKTFKLGDERGTLSAPEIIRPNSASLAN